MNYNLYSSDVICNIMLENNLYDSLYINSYSLVDPIPQFALFVLGISNVCATA